jgi:uncharacterized protein YndB with AHSA1/START domain
MSAEKIIDRTITIAAPALEVWKILTNPEVIKAWLADGDIEAISEWKAGSSIVFKGKLHGYDYFAKGTILEFIPGRIFKYNSWNKIEQLPDEPQNYSIFEFLLEEQEGITALRFMHSNLKAKAQYEHSNMYWNVTLGLIKEMAEKS